MNTGFRTVTKTWHVLGRRVRALDVGDLVNVEQVNEHTRSAILHCGGVIRVEAMIDEIAKHSRESDPDEYMRTLKRCPRCTKIEITEGRWVLPPACFTPRAGLTLVDETCEECDS